MKITMVLMSCGELAEADCLRAIDPFRSEIEFIEIRNAFPQIKALNQMIKSVQTEYFIPLDSDIVLYHDAWPRIGNALRKHYRNPQWHSLLFSLWDTLTERKILALKLMRTEIMKEHVFSESATPDVEHYQRLKSLGYTCIDDYIRLRPIGDHRVAGHKFCYAKYRDVYQTYRSHGYEWDSGAFVGGKTLLQRAKAHFNFFMRKWVQTSNRDYLHCIAGMMDGLISPVENKSKNLQHVEYKVSTNEAIQLFMDWYKENEIRDPEEMLF